MAVLALGISMGAQGAEVRFSYQTSPDSEIQWWGTGKKETYDVAVKIQDPSMVGKTVTGMRVPMATPNVQGVKAWLSTQLSLKKDENGKKVVDADLTIQDASVADGFINVTFDKPYSLTEQGVYVGYTFEVTNADQEIEKNPVAAYPALLQPKGLWIHTSRKYLTWADLNLNAGLVSAMEVKIDGFEPYSAAVGEIPKCYATINTPTELMLSVSNHGSEPISSIEYTYEIAGAKATETMNFPTPLPTLFNLGSPLAVTLPPIADYGDYEGHISMDRVNGQPNGDVSAAKSFKLTVAKFVATARPVLEEFTGLWCGWCPRGFACMQRMTEIYGEDFIAVSYHNNDPMEFAGNIPYQIPGFPYGKINREVGSDPSFADINALWDQAGREFVIGDITAQATWNADKTAIDVASTSRFVGAESGSDYRVVYVLTQNGMKNDDWAQSNYYSGMLSAISGDPCLDAFVEASTPVKGLVFDDVAVYSPDLLGIKGSIPEDFQSGEELTHEIEIDAAKVVNTSGENLIQDSARLSVVAMLVDHRSGRVVNACRAAVTQDVGVNTVLPTEAQAVYYDLAGRRVSRPTHGVFVKVTGGKATKVAL